MEVQKYGPNSIKFSEFNLSPPVRLNYPTVDLGLQSTLSVREPKKSLEKHLVYQWLCVKPGTVFSDKEFNIIVLKPGRLNIHEGPDILDALLVINGELRNGDIECHLSSKSWISHGHDLNDHFKNVILHVVRNSSVIEKTFPFPTIRLSENHKIFPTCNLTYDSLKLSFKNIIQSLAEERWQNHVRDFLKVDGRSLQVYCLEKAFSILGSGGNEKPFRILARSFSETSPNASQSTKIIEWLNSQMKLLDGEWKYRSIRPAHYPRKQVETALELIKFFFMDEWKLKITSDKMIAILNTSVFKKIGRGCHIELLGNVFYPLGASQSIRKGESSVYNQWKHKWNSLILPYSYGKYYRQFKHFLTAKDLRSFSTLQGLKKLDFHFCTKKFCVVCPLKHSNGWLDKSKHN